MRHEVDVIQPKTLGASTDKSSVRMDQMSKKGIKAIPVSKESFQGIFLTMEKMKLQLQFQKILVHLKMLPVPFTQR